MTQPKDAYPILNQKFTRVDDVEQWINAHEKNRLATPELVLWGTLRITFAGQDSLPTTRERTFIKDVGLGVITTWKKESESKDETGIELRNMLVQIALFISELDELTLPEPD